MVLHSPANINQNTRSYDNNSMRKKNEKMKRKRDTEKV